jgi:glucose-6-phosphate isomerase
LPSLTYLTEWWKQLYGESEGKDKKGIFPAGVSFSTDLHSMGQYIQDGERHLFETMLWVKESNSELKITEDDANLDGLNFLSGKSINEVNEKAYLGTILAHNDGNVPIIRIEIPKLTPYYLGQLIYFFEFACAISGYMIDVNPFDQPGVEDYKNNMFALLNKPGFEDLQKRLLERL